jgi:hypothetical protein
MSPNTRTFNVVVDVVVKVDGKQVECVAGPAI